MGKERRTVGPTRRGDVNNARGNPYDRPSGSTQNPTSARERGLVQSSQPTHRQNSMQDDDAERRSSWSSWVYTPLKALKVMTVQKQGFWDLWALFYTQGPLMMFVLLQDSYSYLSKSPNKTDEVDENVGGALRGAPLCAHSRFIIMYSQAQCIYFACAWRRASCQSDRQLDSCRIDRGRRGGWHPCCCYS